MTLIPIYIYRRDVKENKGDTKPGATKNAPALQRPLSTIAEEPNIRQKRAGGPQKPRPNPSGPGNNHPGNSNSHPVNNGKPQGNHPGNNGKPINQPGGRPGSPGPGGHNLHH